VTNGKLWKLYDQCNTIYIKFIWFSYGQNDLINYNSKKRFHEMIGLINIMIINRKKEWLNRKKRNNKKENKIIKKEKENY